MNRLLLTPEQRQQIEALLASLTPDTDSPLRRRALALLLYDSGKATRDVAIEAGLSRSRSRYWRRQFLARGMSIFYAIDNHSPVSALPALLPSAPEPLIEVAQADEPLLESVFQVALSNPPGEMAFPKPMERVGIEPQDSMAEAGRKTLLFHFAEMLSHEAGTRLGADIEELHDMRVATRRMRAAFDIFGDSFTPKAIKPHLKGLRAAGRVLGQVRDLDVFIEKAQRYIENLSPPARLGLNPLVNTWEQQREAARARMLSHLDSKEYQEFKEKFNIFLQTPGKGARSPATDAPAPNRVCEVAPVLIYTRLACVRAYETILNNARLDQLHALRIEFKRLRYAVEFFREVLGEVDKQVIQTL